MSSKNEEKNGCTTIVILFSILILGLIVRLFMDTEGLLKDLWWGFLSIIVIVIISKTTKLF